METVVLDKFVVMGMLSLITLFLGAVTYLLKQSHADLKQILKDHENRIRAVEDHKIEMVGLVKQHEKDIDEHKELMTRLSENVNRLSRI